jgi:hypothetical protein
MCETWHLILMEEHKLRAFEGRELVKTSGPRQDQMVGGWRTVHYEKLYKLYPSTRVIRIFMLWRIRWDRQVTCMGRRGVHIAKEICNI